MKLYFIIRSFVALFYNKARLFYFQHLWRTKNSNNTTTAANIFPINIVTVGNNSYGPLIVESWGSEGESLSIGSFCSIASNVKFVLGGNHKTNYLSTFPFKYFYNDGELEASSKGKISIGDDVWIGMDVTIHSGVEIGQGCVIAAGSCVTKSFSPYSIIGGVPSKIIRNRFSPETISILEKINYSKLSNDKIREKLDAFYSDVSTMSQKELLEHLQYLDIALKTT